MIAFKVWSRFRLVRAGLFTATEAMSYIDYFYKYISPLTPVNIPNYSRYEDHLTLLKDDEMLAMTMLMIASRFAKLPGPGSSTRPQVIHEKLWEYLQKMIHRTIWAQEQFGGFDDLPREPGDAGVHHRPRSAGLADQVHVDKGDGYAGDTGGDDFHKSSSESASPLSTDGRAASPLPNV